MCTAAEIITYWFCIDKGAHLSVDGVKEAGQFRHRGIGSWSR